MNDDGNYSIKDIHDQHEIMRQFMFLNDNKKLDLNSIRKESVSPHRAKSKNHDENVFTFKPKITQKSRNMAETFKKNFTEVSMIFINNLLEAINFTNRIERWLINASITVPHNRQQ